VADAVVRTAFGHQREHVPFACCQVAERIVGPVAADELCDDFGIDGSPAAGDAPDGVEEVVYLNHAVLEQIAEAFGSFREEPESSARLDYLGEEKDPDGRIAGADLLCCLRALVRLRWRHAYVHNRDVGLIASDLE
jgi:hypothetical protein